MLDTMRHIASSLLAKLLLVLLVVSFGLWGVGDILRSNGTSYVAKVGDETIGVGELQQEQARIARQMQAAGITVDPTKIQVAVLRQLVQQKLVTQALEQAGLHVNNGTIARAIAHDPQFQTLDGKFSDTAYHAALREQRLSEGAFLAATKKQIVGNFMLASLDVSDMQPPASVLALTTAVENETRDAVLITIPASAAHEPTPEEVQAFYDEYKDTLYQQPERRTLEFVTPAAADIQALIDKTITADMLSVAQAASPKTAPEKIRENLRAEQRDGVLRELSNAVEDALAGGASMGEALAKTGLRADSRMLSNVTADQFKLTNDMLSRTVTEQGFALNQGEVSHLIVTPQGTYVMVSVKAITPAQPKALVEVKADATAKTRQRIGREAAKLKAAELKLALADATDWRSVLAKQQVSGREVTQIKRPVEGKTASSIPASLATAIFEQPVGKTAGPLAQADGDQLLALVLASHHPKPNMGNAASDASIKAAVNNLNLAIQNQAFAHFAASQGVRVNPKAFATTDSE